MSKMDISNQIKYIYMDSKAQETTGSQILVSRDNLHMQINGHGFRYHKIYSSSETSIS